MPETLELPTDWAPDVHDLRHALIGNRLTADGGIDGHASISLFRSNIVVFGQKGSGTSNVTDLIIANALARDCATWIIDLDGAWDARRWLSPILQGKKVLPAPDWVATTRQDAISMIERAAELSARRAADRTADNGEDYTDQVLLGQFVPAARQVVIVITSGADKLGLHAGAPDNAETAHLRETLIRIARENVPWQSNNSDGGVNLVINTKSLVGLGPIAEYMTTRIGCGNYSDDDEKAAFGKMPDGYTRRRGWATVSTGMGPAIVQPYWISPDRIAELAEQYGKGHRPTLDDDEADELGGTYLWRWHRALNQLNGGVPDHLKRYGLPVLPADLSRATRRQLEFALGESPSVGSEAQQAAAYILLNACNEKLLSYPLVLSTLTVENGVLYVRWDQIRNAARDIDNGYDSAHPDAGIMLRVAAHLATGGFTAANAEVLLNAMIDITPDVADDNEGEQA